DTIKVADFGIARIVEESSDDEAEAGEVIGSARYMSPEQLTGRRATPRSDIYSVGILLYHLLTGEPPFSGDTKSVARQQLHREPLPPRRLNRKIPAPLEASILRALSKDPSERFASADEMLAEIRRQKTEKRNAPALLGRMFGGSRRRSLATAAVAAVLISGLTAAGVSGYVGGDLASSGSSQESSPEQIADQQRNSLFQGSGDEEDAGGATTAETTASGQSVRVPSVETYYDYYASDVLSERGFETEVVHEYREGYSDRGVTWKTEPAAGETAPEGSKITIYATPEDQPQPQF
ncbi:MAG: protein kinase, partial [Rubrobacter sp.]|nr:protein kinase [Rubrobacter sp.]